MQIYLIYPLYTGVIFLITLVLVPLRDIRRLLFFGIVFGALLDALWLTILSITGAAEYINYGPFGFMGVPFFPLIAWTCFFIVYFYFLPELKIYRYLYISIAAIYSILFSNILQNLGIFVWHYDRFFIPLLVYSSWHIFAAWGYLRLKVQPLNMN